MAYYLSNAEQEAKEYTPRYRLLYSAVAISVFIIFCRLWYLQIIQGSVLAEFSEKNRIKQTQIAAPRGVILDRNGEVLVDNLPGFEVTITPQYASNLEETAGIVAKILEMDRDAIIRKVRRSKKRNGPFFPYRVKENLSREEVFRLKLVRLDHPGLEINESILRSYPLKENGAQLFGYVGEITKKQLPRLNKKMEGKVRFRQGDIIGKTGLEETFDLEIRGKNGISFLEVDARGRELSKSSTNVSRVLGAVARFRAPRPGFNIQLTLDKTVQKAAYDSFVSKNERIGSVLALKPNGEVLAWVSSPSYDPNTFSTGFSSHFWKTLLNTPFKPLRNKVLQDHAAPGSTFKAVVALAGLQEKVITPQTTYSCPGWFKFGRRRYHCWAKHGHGKVNLFQALERSCNVYFYKLGSLLGIDRMARYAKALGIGDRTGIDLRGEVPGLMPTSEWKKQKKGEEWQPGENLSNAIGQGFINTTPLQMAAAYSAIGAEGPLFQPFLVKKVINHQGQLVRETEPQFRADLSSPDEKGSIIIEKKNFQAVKEGLRLVANGDKGTARYWKIPGVQIAGKTGTSQLFTFATDQVYAKCDEKPIEQRHHGWYVGFAPAEKPLITVAVLAQHSCAGSSGAAPIVRDVIRSYLEKYHPELLKKKKTKFSFMKVEN